MRTEELDEFDAIIARMSETQKEVLRQGSLGVWRMRFRTGEALRKLGLLNRSSIYILKREDADADGVYSITLFPRAAPKAHHEWTVTPTGLEVGIRLKDAAKGMAR